MFPAAPARFSTTTGWPHFSDSFSPRMRGIRSALPPAGNGTMMRTGLDGHCCAAAARLSAPANTRAQKGIAGKGGMPPDARPESQAPKKLRVEALCGLVFGTLSDATPRLTDYIGPQILPRMKRVMVKPLKVLGTYTQMLPNNWKLYMDNVKDTYHASLLHLFFTRFRINRLTQKGGVFVSADGAHHCTYTEIVEDRGDAYEKGGMRSANEFALQSRETLEQVD